MNSLSINSLSINPLSVISHPSVSSPADAKLAAKVRHAAQQFESILIESLLEPLEKSFSTLPGRDDLSGADTYHYLGTQALASALSQSGGLGMAAMMVRTMLTNNDLHPKALTHLADGIR